VLIDDPRASVGDAVAQKELAAKTCSLGQALRRRRQSPVEGGALPRPTSRPMALADCHDIMFYIVQATGDIVEVLRVLHAARK
jgi:plasmid stabilization system protein ParE